MWRKVGGGGRAWALTTGRRRLMFFLKCCSTIPNNILSPWRRPRMAGAARPSAPTDPGRHAMKKLINSPDPLVTDALAGLAAAHPSLAVDLENRVITRSSGPSEGKVGLVSGGGSGH